MTQAPTEVAALLTPSALLTATAGLVAFHIGFYSLIGRERKSPYVINRVFPVFLACLVIAAVSVTATLVPDRAREWVLVSAATMLAFAFLGSFVVVYGIAVRFLFFVDSVNPKHLPVVRHFRRWRNRDKLRKYNHKAVPIAPELGREIRDVVNKFSATPVGDTDLNSLAVSAQHQGQGNRLLADLASAFLKHSCTVQYLTASRHPIEFIGYLRSHVELTGGAWHDWCGRIVVIDAYSAHFAFTDSIYARKDIELEDTGVQRVASKETYAGMHSASSRAFNLIEHVQGRAGKDQRWPTLVIYEDTYALSDLESPEQYRIFVRHVMPSERMWGGMFTVFLESAQQQQDWGVLRAYASVSFTLENDPAGHVGCTAEDPVRAASI